MAAPENKLAESLAVLKKLQNHGRMALRSIDMTRTHRERLLKNGYIKEVMKGWYITSRPDDPAGESTSWYASFWNFCVLYFNVRFGDEWCLSPEQSINLHTGNWNVPRQLTVRSPKGGNKTTELLYNTSILEIRKELPTTKDTEFKDGLRVYTLPAALLACYPVHFKTYPTEIRTAIAMVEPSDLLRRLLAGGHSIIAGRLAGAFRNIGRDQIAMDITNAMRTAGYKVIENDPFAEKFWITIDSREKSPYVNRMRINWAKMREKVLETFPDPPGIVSNMNSYLKRVDEVYVTDSYHSLSIEGYQVSEELIEKVRTGNWNSEGNKADQDQRNALAARGYWLAFQKVKQSIEKVLNEENAGIVAENDHSTWYRELFAPSVTAGIINATNLAGYRNGPVYIRRSMHTPPQMEAVHELMPAFFELLQKESEPCVRIVLGHFMFVYIHPYSDGNGRMGRFLMNLMMASGGYQWTIIPYQRRNDYMSALERASVEEDIKPFSTFIAELVLKNLEEAKSGKD